MIVTFKTRGGAVYHIDHVNNQFVQESPTERVGPLWGLPAVVVGKRVNILTAPDEGDRHTAKLIQTGIVVSREVVLEPLLQEPQVLSGEPG